MPLTYNDWKELQTRLNEFNDTGINQMLVELTNEIGARLLRMVIKRTPTVSSDLKGAWKASGVTKSGFQYYVEITNSMNYASYVEFGHRQLPGRFIPGEWKGGRFIYNPDWKNNDVGGMKLKAPWVKGRFMLTKSEMEMKGKIKGIIEARITKELERIFR